MSSNFKNNCFCFVCSFVRLFLSTPFLGRYMFSLSYHHRLGSFQFILNLIRNWQTEKWNLIINVHEKKNWKHDAKLVNFPNQMCACAYFFFASTHSTMEKKTKNHNIMEQKCENILQLVLIEQTTCHEIPRIRKQIDHDSYYWYAMLWCSRNLYY